MYGMDYLSDPKMIKLNATQRALWVTILCLSSKSELEIGLIKGCGADEILYLTNATEKEKEQAGDFLGLFEQLGMIKRVNKDIFVVNFKKRQDRYQTNAEKQAGYRERKKLIGKVTNVTLDKNRVDKKYPYTEDRPPESFNKWLEIVSLQKDNVVETERSLVRHKEFTPLLLKEHQKAMKLVTDEDLEDAVRIYASVLEHEQTWFTYRWNYMEFCQRGYKKFLGKTVSDFLKR